MDRSVFKIFFYNLYHILYSQTCCEWVFYIKDFSNDHIAIFYLPTFPTQARPKLSEILYTDIVYTVNIDAIPASYDIKYIIELLRLDEQYQQIVKQQQIVKPTNETTHPQVIFSFERKDYTIAQFLTVFSADFFGSHVPHNVISPESPCAAILVSVPTLNLLIIVIPASTNYKIYYCDN